MFVHDKFIFLELPKTGCTHVRRLMHEVLDGELDGKHNSPGEEMLSSGRKVIGSMRNPWDFYLSLWSFGCRREVGLRKHLGQRNLRFRGLGWKSQPGAAVATILRGLQRKPEEWVRLYQDVEDVGAFREWLYRMNDPKLRFDLNKNYGDGVCWPFAGYMTHYYVLLYCKNRKSNEFRSIKSLGDLKKFEADNYIVDEMIHTENLEDDLIQCLANCGVELSTEQQEHVRSAGTTNTSARDKGAAHYYDDATIQLVTNREALIVEKFGDTFPE